MGHKEANKPSVRDGPAAVCLSAARLIGRWCLSRSRVRVLDRSVLQRWGEADTHKQPHITEVNGRFQSLFAVVPGSPLCWRPPFLFAHLNRKPQGGWNVMFHH